MNMNAVQVLLGAEGIKQAYQESMKQDSLDIVCLSSNYDQVIGDFFEKEFSPVIYGKVKTREILPDTLENRKSLTVKDRAINDVKFITSVTASESDMLVWNDRVILISFASANPMALVITEPELIKSFKSQFKALWENLA